MGKKEIKTKLRDILTKETFDEIDVVYILRSIRKVLDVEKNKKYQKLRFYCNWALHIQINDTSAVKEELGKFPDDMEASYRFIMYESFHKDLKEFLTEYNLTTSLYKDNNSVFKFNELLTNIYTDTPLVVKSVKKKIITLKSGEYIQNNVGGTSIKYAPVEFTVTYEE